MFYKGASFSYNLLDLFVMNSVHLYLEHCTVLDCSVINLSEFIYDHELCQLLKLRLFCACSFFYCYFSLDLPVN